MTQAAAARTRVSSSSTEWPSPTPVGAHDGSHTSKHVIGSSRGELETVDRSGVRKWHDPVTSRRHSPLVGLGLWSTCHSGHLVTHHEGCPEARKLSIEMSVKIIASAPL